MRKSQDVRLVLLTSIALSMTACRNQPQNCVDSKNRLLSPSACQTGGTSGAHYVYGGSSGGHVGDSVVGGSLTRGGFGSLGGFGEGGE